jgi:pyruvate dehydrogenase E2 component (dihydrolipoamide acetyltransferase)
MSTEFKLPELGENIETADVLNVLIKTGDTVEKDQGVIEIETDKATIEVPSTISGIVQNVLVKSGDKVKVGQAIMVVQETGAAGGNGEKKESTKPEKQVVEEKTPKEEKKNKEPAPQEKAETKPPAAAKNSAVENQILEMKLPELGENIESADVLNILVNVGDVIEKDQGILEIETDKATIEVPSTLNGKVVEVLIKAGEKAKVGQALIKVAAEVSSAPAQQKEASKDEPNPAPAKAVEESLAAAEKVEAKGERESILPSEKDDQPPIQKGAAPAAPSVRRIAREIGVDINKVPGTGPSNRITMDDVKNYAKMLNEGRSSQPAVGFKQEPLPDFSKYGSIEKKPMSNIRSKTAEHLSYAWSAIPHVTQHDKADITELENLRKQLNPKVEKKGGKLTVTAILLKIISSALKVYPQFNASIDLEKKEIIYKKFFNIGIAVDTEHGLIVPVIKNVDQKNITELSIELNTIAEKARIRKISLDELQGGCFTITNLGGIGGTSFTPIINSPEVAILGVSRGSFEPVLVDGKFEPRMMLPLSLSYDHRIIDGADAARFLRWVCEALEKPIKILIEG